MIDNLVLGYYLGITWVLQALKVKNKNCIISRQAEVHWVYNAREFGTPPKKKKKKKNCDNYVPL